MATTDERTRPQRRRKGWAQEQNRAVYRIVVFLVGLLLRVWVRHFRAIGVEKVPSAGGLFLVANHTSGMDPFLLGYPASHRRMSGPGKVELFRNRFIGYLMRKLGIFPVRTGAADAAAVRTMVELYRAGKIVIVYPEGGRSKDGELLPFLPEFARLAIRLRAPLLPAAIAGARELLPIGSLIPKRGKPVVVAYGDEFDLSVYYDRPADPELYAEAAGVIRDRVAQLLATAREERARLPGA